MGKFEQIERRAAEKGFLKFVFLRTRQKIDGLIAKIARKNISRKNPIQKNKVVFMHYNNKYECNPKYICDEILNQGLDWDLVYVVNKKAVNNFPSVCPNGVRVVGRNTLEHFREMASAKIWVDNAVCFPWEYVPKKKDQIYIDTWHGSMGLKRIDSNKIVSKKWAKAAKVAGKEVNYMISNSAFETEVYRTTYWENPNVKVLEYGHPRNDILFCDEQAKAELKKKVCEFYEIDEEEQQDCKFLLYAPTFRDDKNISVYDIDYNRLLDALTKRFGGNWKILNRYHFKISKVMGTRADIKENPNILNGNSYSDIQELMSVCDLGITDYSSWICDYVLTGKPGFIYASDLEDYNDERGFYYPLESTPFPIAVNNDELYEKIVNFDEKLYEENRQKFLEARGCKETGNAAKQVVELMKSFIEE